MALYFSKERKLAEQTRFFQKWTAATSNICGRTITLAFQNYMQDHGVRHLNRIQFDVHSQNPFLFSVLKQWRGLS